MVTEKVMAKTQDVEGLKGEEQEEGHIWYVPLHGPWLNQHNLMTLILLRRSLGKTIPRGEKLSEWRYNGDEGPIREARCLP